MQFSIGPASGRSASISTNLIRSNGITLKGALATAYDVPAVRLIGPQWLADTRYSINAVVGIDESDAFRTILQQELQNRLRLETHFEVRPFDVFVLTATAAPRLERAVGSNLRVWINDRNVEIQDASMGNLASALQNILGKPVIDETGMAGSVQPGARMGRGSRRVRHVRSARPIRASLDASQTGYGSVDRGPDPARCRTRPAGADRPDDARSTTAPSRANQRGLDNPLRHDETCERIDG